MRYVHGDLWQVPADWRVVTTNGVVKADGSLVMGAGVALEAARRFPDVPLRWGRWTRQYGSRVFLDRSAGLVAFPTKTDWRRPSPLELVELSTRQLVAIADKFALDCVVLPFVGCGNG